MQIYIHGIFIILDITLYYCVFLTIRFYSMVPIFANLYGRQSTSLYHVYRRVSNRSILLSN